MNQSAALASLERHKPCCIVVVDHSGMRFFRYWPGEMATLKEETFRIDISQWKKKDLGHVARPGIKMTRGSQRDIFTHRVDAQYSRLWRETATRTRQICEQEDLTTIFLVGSADKTPQSGIPGTVSTPNCTNRKGPGQAFRSRAATTARTQDCSMDTSNVRFSS